MLKYIYRPNGAHPLNTYYEYDTYNCNTYILVIDSNNVGFGLGRNNV